MTAFTALLWLPVGCTGYTLNDLTVTDPIPDLAVPVSTNVQGVVAQTPSNWSIEQETETAEGFTIVTLTAESSGSGMMLVQTFRPPLELDATVFLTNVQEGMQGALGDGVLGSVTTIVQGGQRDVSRTMFGAPLAGRAGTFDIEVFGEKVPTTLEVFTTRLEGVSVVVLLQAADEDLTTVSPAFDHLVSTLSVAPVAKKIRAPR